MARPLPLAALMALLPAGCEGGPGARPDADTGPVDDDGDGWTVAGGDCDDTDRSVHPGARERVADGIDQDCDGGDVCWQDTDADGDGYTVADTIVSEDLDCTDPREAPLGGDCDDGDPGVHPEAEETCEDGVDDDCDGRDSRCELAGEISLSTADATFLGERELDFAGGSARHGGRGWRRGRRRPRRGHQGRRFCHEGRSGLPRLRRRALSGRQVAPQLRG